MAEVPEIFPPEPALHRCTDGAQMPFLSAQTLFNLHDKSRLDERPYSPNAESEIDLIGEVDLRSAFSPSRAKWCGAQLHRWFWLLGRPGHGTDETTYRKL